MARTCVFVDGGYFQKVLEKSFGKPPVDFAVLGPELSRGFEPYLRTYYYNCLPYQGGRPTVEESQRFKKAQGFYDRLERISNLTVRLGRLQYRGTDREGRSIFEQKRIDVQLAVDLITLAFSRQIATAVLVAGDSDFVPVFDAVKNQGVRVVLVHGGRDNPAHNDLIKMADQAVVMDSAFIDRVKLSRPAR